MIDVKDLRVLLKGVKGSATIHTGNCSYYSHKEENENTLNIDMDTGAYEEKDNSKITEVVFWFEE